MSRCRVWKPDFWKENHWHISKKCNDWLSDKDYVWKNLSFFLAPSHDPAFPDSVTLLSTWITHLSVLDWHLFSGCSVLSGCLTLQFSLFCHQLWPLKWAALLCRISVRAGEIFISLSFMGPHGRTPLEWTPGLSPLLKAVWWDQLESLSVKLSFPEAGWISPQKHREIGPIFLVLP